jgi:hypothetical protein
VDAAAEHDEANEADEADAPGTRREARGDATAERVARVEILSVDAG